MRTQWRTLKRQRCRTHTLTQTARLNPRRRPPRQLHPLWCALLQVLDEQQRPPGNKEDVFIIHLKNYRQRTLVLFRLFIYSFLNIAGESDVTLLPQKHINTNIWKPISAIVVLKKDPTSHKEKLSHYSETLSHNFKIFLRVSHCCSHLFIILGKLLILILFLDKGSLFLIFSNTNSKF